MPKSRTDITAKKSDPRITVFFSPDLRRGSCGSLSAAVIGRAAALFLAYHRVTSPGLSLVFVTGRISRKINRERLGHDYATDIITFDLRENGSDDLDGELVICLPEAARNARVFGESLEREILRYVAHGILHLLGFDDATDKQRAMMHREENKLLALIWP